MTALHLPLGPVMADLAGYSLDQAEKRRLCDPAVGGVILFRRNYRDPEQLTALCREIKSLRYPELLIAVDHEGGRVQRFIDGFTRLPAMRVFGEMWDARGETAACAAAEETAWVLAAELRACGVDLSFTPVLDLDWGNCAVIGNRSFHRDPAAVSALAAAVGRGLRRGGMQSCGKHFPGHGFVGGDSHHVLPEDPRSFEEMLAADLVPFAELAARGMAAVMPAHVLYPQIDALPAGFSPFWLQTVLRGRLGFDGVIFSDDLTMEGACGGGTIAERSRLALAAGCDVVLVCNRPDLADELLAAFRLPASGLADLAARNTALAARWARMAGAGSCDDFAALRTDPAFRAAQERVAALSSARDTAGGVPVGESC